MIELIGLVGLGLLVGVLSGLFGVGGGFLLVPMLSAVFNIPYNIAVGSSLCQMVGTSGAAAFKHRSYGHIDYKLGILLLLGAVFGAEIGAQALMLLKNLGDVTIHGHTITKMYVWINIIYTVMLSSIGGFMLFESAKARKNPHQSSVQTKFSQRLQALKTAPCISLPVSQIKSVSVWAIVLLGFGVGILSGLLGVGGGFVITPALIYLVGVPTGVSIGTGLFQIVFVSGYGAITHFVKNNIDWTVVVCILCGSLIGSQIGAVLHKKLHAANIRYYFSWIIILSIIVIIVKFLYNTGFIGN